MKAFLTEVLVNRSHSIIPLFIHRQELKNISLFRSFIGFQVQGELVDGANAYEGNFIFFIYPGFYLELKIIVGGRKGKFQDGEKKFAGRTGVRNTIKVVLSVTGPSSVKARSDAPKDPLNFILSLLPSSWLKSKTELMAFPRLGRECTGIVFHFTDKVNIDYSHRTSRGSLRGKVVEVGYLDAVEVKPVFTGSPASDDKIIAERYGSADPWERLDHLGYITVTAGILFNFGNFNYFKRNGTFFLFPERRCFDRYRRQLDAGFLHGNFNEDFVRIGNLEIFGISQVQNQPKWPAA